MAENRLAGAVGRTTANAPKRTTKPVARKQKVVEEIIDEVEVEEAMPYSETEKVVFAIDLGNHQTKLKSELGEYVYSSSYIDTSKLPTNGFNTVEITGNEIYGIENERATFAWGSNLDAFNRSEDMIVTYSRTDRFAKKNAQRLLKFALAKLASDFPESYDRPLKVRVVLGVPITDANKNSSTISTLKEIVVGVHAVKVDGRTVLVSVESDEDVAVVAQYMGTAVNLSFDDEMNENIEFSQGTLALCDIGGGTILGNIVSNLQPNPNGTEKFQGAEVLISSIAGAEGVTRHSLVEKMLREGNPEDGFIYRPTKNDKDNRDMTETVIEEIENYTRFQVANFITSTFSDIENFDYIIMTGGGINLIDIEALREEVGEEYFEKMIFVEESELANVRGYYKISNLVWG